MESVGFKEWALVCKALGDGRQSVIVRKGGIAEGRDGFQFRHPEFFLFPTFFHEQLGRTRLTNTEFPERLPDEIEIRSFVRIEETHCVEDWEKARALAPLHILQESVVRERFDYDSAPGVQVAFVRVFRLASAWRFPDAPRYGGCRSWVELPEVPPKLQLYPVLDDAKQEQRRAQFERAVRPSA
ncbi:MAG TPA: DUF1802 family protein [Chthoniobacterales bacterium]|jgi:hypothetical protein